MTSVGPVSEYEVHRSVESLPMLSEEECESIRSTVFELRSSWCQRKPLLPFYTLGASSYIDAQKNESDYLARAAAYNPILLDNFSWLYKRLTDLIAKRLGSSAGYRSNLGLPGFHIFLAHLAYTKLQPSIHADIQHTYLDWSWAHWIGRPISFTVAVSLPHEGSGINMWKTTLQQLAGLTKEEVKHVLCEADRTFFPYEIGHLNLHFGHLMHQVAPPKRLFKGDDRITLQGHGLLCDGIWQLYW